jgi:enterochelin esterase-like enzyme
MKLNRPVLLTILLITLLSSCQQKQTVRQGSAKEQFRYYNNVESKYVKPRNVEVWLPAGYDSTKAYPVLYMHDGQNVFNPETSYTKIDWGVDEVMDSLVAAGKVRPAIVVGIWNTNLRINEYMPDVELNAEQQAEMKKMSPEEGILSRQYLRFIVEELKPFIDSTFHTLPDRDHTFIMGSSMGGLISLYAVCSYPEVFGAAACLSTHWPALGGVTLSYIEKGLPDPATHRFYFDHGTATLDSLYEPFQQKANEIFTHAGYGDGNYMSRKFEGAEHSEKAWRKRIYIPLEFLLGRKTN